MNKKRRVLVIGVGNMLMRDDGIGVHVIGTLQKEPLPEGIDVELIDAGISPDLAVYVDAGIDKLIVIDAVQAKGKPGTIYRLTPDIFLTEGKEMMSLHDLDLRDSLAQMRILGILPSEIIVIGIEPGEMGWGMTLTPEVEAKIPEIVRVTINEITNV